MPWNQANVKTFDALRDPKLSREIFRSGCYERAIAALQSTADLNTKTATVASLHELLKAAGVDDPQAAAGQQHDRQPKTQQEVLVAKTIRQEREKAKADKAQLRRERQQQRHEDSMALRQQRHEKKVKIRREEFTAELLQGEEQRDKMLAHLKEQQHSLQQQLAVQQEVLFQLPSPHTSVDNDQALKTLHQQLQCLQKQKEQAEEQLELVSSPSACFLPHCIAVQLISMPLMCCSFRLARPVKRCFVELPALSQKMVNALHRQLRQIILSRGSCLKHLDKCLPNQWKCCQRQAIHCLTCVIHIMRPYVV